MVFYKRLYEFIGYWHGIHRSRFFLELALPIIFLFISWGAFSIAEGEVNYVIDFASQGELLTLTCALTLSAWLEYRSGSLAMVADYVSRVKNFVIAIAAISFVFFLIARILVAIYPRCGISSDPEAVQKIERFFPLIGWASVLLIFVGVLGSMSLRLAVAYAETRKASEE